MDWFTSIAIYLTIWWTVLFAILPLGVTSHHEAGIAPPRGCDPASPVKHNMWRKAITTSWVSAIVWAVVWAIIQFKLIPLPSYGGV
jgi:predicted secreted protein